MSIEKKYRFYLLSGLVFIVVALGCFLNLGGRNFGVDEAETAVLGENILNYGIPMAWNGRGLIDNVAVKVNGWCVDEDLVFVSHPWFPYYLSALLIAIFAKSHFWLRAGFALFGFTGFVLLYFLVKRLSNYRIAFLTLIIVALNVHYYLFTRSYRHYPLNIFFAVLAIWGYFFIEERWGKFCLITGLTLLYHTNYIPFGILYLAFAAMLLLERDWPKTKGFLGCSLLGFFLTFPFFLYLKPYNNLGSYRESNTLLDYASFFRDIDSRFIPLILFAGYGIWLFNQRQTSIKGNKEQQLKVFCLVYPLTSMLVEPLVIPEILVRNAAPVLLFLSLAAAYLLEALFRKSKAWAIVLAMLLLFTNVLSELFYFSGVMIFDSQKPGLKERYVNELKNRSWRVFLKMEPYYFIQELYTPFYSSQQAIIEFLKEHAQEDDIIYYYSDEARSLQFYTNFRLAYQVHKNSPYRYKFSSLPSWATTDEYFDWYIPINERYKRRMLTRISQLGGKFTRYELEPKFLSHWDLPFEHVYIPYVQDSHLHHNPVKALRQTEVYRIIWDKPPPNGINEG